MIGYGYSIWLIPDDWKRIKEDFNMDFIPHVTIATNLPYLPYGILDNKTTFTVKNFKKGKIFPRMYQVDPLYAFGYPCEIVGLYPDFEPHMTLFYSPNEIKELDTFSWIKTPPLELKCKLHIANTNYINPTQWHSY